MKFLIIIPTYNEAQNIQKLIPVIFAKLKGVSFSILVVDDSSTDGTVDIVKGLNYENVHILSRPSKQGLATAYIQGMKYGIKEGFDAFIEFDADFSHDPEYLPLMTEYLSEHDVVIGSRNIKGGGVVGWSFLRNLISKGGSIYSRIVLNCPIKDLTGGFNGWKKEIIEKINLDSIISKGYCFQIEMKYRAYQSKADIIEFPIIFKDRIYGESKMDKSIFLEALFNIIKLKIKMIKAGFNARQN
ncbi:MAG: polyprenol monophosphomannose synthase [Candidatus Gastranaerophilales bacterium]|nr:polyprenol monophosphomannose synthase [Candidatus Gastranaerophilales bacterium]